MATVMAERLLAYLDSAGFVLMNKPPAGAPTSALHRALTGATGHAYDRRQMLDKAGFLHSSWRSCAARTRASPSCPGGGSWNAPSTGEHAAQTGQ
jgi:hypothetical protein